MRSANRERKVLPVTGGVVRESAGGYAFSGNLYEERGNSFQPPSCFFQTCMTPILVCSFAVELGLRYPEMAHDRGVPGDRHGHLRIFQ